MATDPPNCRRSRPDDMSGAHALSGRASSGTTQRRIHGQSARSSPSLSADAPEQASATRYENNTSRLDSESTPTRCIAHQYLPTRSCSAFCFEASQRWSDRRSGSHEIVTLRTTPEWREWVTAIQDSNMAFTLKGRRDHWRGAGLSSSYRYLAKCGDVPVIVQQILADAASTSDSRYQAMKRAGGLAWKVIKTQREREGRSVEGLEDLPIAPNQNA